MPLETPIADKGIPKETGPEVTFQVLVMAEGTQPLAVRRVAMDLIYQAYALRTTRTIAGARMRVSPVLLADVSFASCVRAMMETIEITRS